MKQQFTKIESNISATVWQHLIGNAVHKAIFDLGFCVSIADPRTADTELIAVSRGFEEMTGYKNEEIVGRNCRFLNHDCELNTRDREGLRFTSQTGAPFSAVIVNRRKSGELFKNLLNVRGLVIARNMNGEDLWLLVGIQADVTELDDVPESRLDSIGRCIRKELCKELAAVAVSAALKRGFNLDVPFTSQTSSSSSGSSGINRSWMGEAANMWRLLPDVSWRPGVEMSAASLPAFEEAQENGETMKHDDSASCRSPSVIAADSYDPWRESCGGPLAEISQGFWRVRWIVAISSLAIGSFMIASRIQKNRMGARISLPSK
jgi:PAS domain S-box-containing protein